MDQPNNKQLSNSSASLSSPERGETSAQTCFQFYKNLSRQNGRLFSFYFILGHKTKEMCIQIKNQFASITYFLLCVFTCTFVFSIFHLSVCDMLVSFVSHRTASPSNHRPIRSSSNRRSIAGLPEETSRAKTPTVSSPHMLQQSLFFIICFILKKLTLDMKKLTFKQLLNVISWSLVVTQIKKHS